MPSSPPRPAALQAYECLANLEGTSIKAQKALESGTKVNLQEAKNLNSYFQKACQMQRSVIVACLRISSVLIYMFPTRPLCGGGGGW